MKAAAGVAAELPLPGSGGGARCPHLVFRNVLGAATVARLLEHVSRHQQDFRPAIIRSRQSGERRVDLGQRDCLYLGNLGPFKQMIAAFVRDATPRLLAELQLAEAAVEPREFEICAYGDGGHFGSHVDTNELTVRVRVISCVYYFAGTPPRFDGGALRLYGFPGRAAANASAAPAFVDIAPQTDTLVAFPSWLRHEVRPVQVPSGMWSDRRFSVNCWLLRASRAGEGGQPGH